MNTMPLHLLLVLLTTWFSLFLSALAQTPAAIGDTRFQSSHNFTSCLENASLAITFAERYYDPVSKEYSFRLNGVSSIAVTELSRNMTLYASSRTEVLLGFSVATAQMGGLCQDVQGGCPVEIGNVSIHKSTILPDTSLPLADIITRYTAWTTDDVQWGCVVLAPVGYQHPTWHNIFIYLPVGITIFAALVSFIATFATFSDTEHDVFLFTSNYAMLPGALRLKTPGFFDLIYYVQFVVTTGQLSLAYPQFYPLFTANFGWSFLLFTPDWMKAILNNVFPPPAEPEMTTFALNGTQADSTVDVQGTGMANFALAMDIDVNGLFLTCLIFFLIILAAALLLCLLIWITVLVLRRINPERFGKETSKAINFTLGICLRVLTLMYLPLMTLSFYQLMLPAPWYIVLPAALVLAVAIFLLYGYIAFILGSIRPTSVMFSDVPLLLRYGSLYNTFTDDRYYFFIFAMIYRVVVGAMVGGFQASGLAQIIVILLAEIVYLVLHFVKWPYASREVNVQYIVYGSIRVIITALNLAYVDAFHVLDRDRQAVAYAQLVFHGIVFLAMLALPIRNLLVLITGFGDDDLYESDIPPARMAFWRRRRFGKRSQSHHRVSTTSLSDDDGDDSTNHPGRPSASYSTKDQAVAMNPGTTQPQTKSPTSPTSPMVMYSLLSNAPQHPSHSSHLPQPSHPPPPPPLHRVPLDPTISASHLVSNVFNHHAGPFAPKSKEVSNHHRISGGYSAHHNQDALDRRRTGSSWDTFGIERDRGQTSNRSSYNRDSPHSPILPTP